MKVFRLAIDYTHMCSREMMFDEEKVKERIAYLESSGDCRFVIEWAEIDDIRNHTIVMGTPYEGTSDELVPIVSWQPYYEDEVFEFMELDGVLLGAPCLTPHSYPLAGTIKDHGYTGGIVTIKTRCTKYREGKVVDVSTVVDDIFDLEDRLLEEKEERKSRAREIYANVKVPKNAVPVTYNGVTYPSKAACRACEDISSAKLEAYLKRNKPDANV